LFSVGSVRRIAAKLYSRKIELDAGLDLITPLWEDRPTGSGAPVFEHTAEFAGQTRLSKIQAVRDKMQDADHYLITTLDDIAWLLNLRGSDVHCNPVFYSFLLLSKERVTLFVNKDNIPGKLSRILNNDGIIIHPYEAISDFLGNILETERIHVDFASINNEIFNAVKPESVIEGANLVASLKAIKNPVETDHVRNAMVKDAVALVRLFRWLEQELVQKAIPESDVAKQLIRFREEQEGYYGESFDAIVGYASNGAIVHYKPEEATCALIEAKGILLVDSGGHYSDGTTDITRTIALSPPAAEEKTDFTLVLKGMIALSRAVFPVGTTGVQLDTLARMHLWSALANYGHGTGHGVGFFNNVHEGPQGFTPAPNTPRAGVKIEPGMLTSNEPGLYKIGKYGIRIENLILCVPAGTSEFGEFYKFETLTLFPIDTALLDFSLLDKQEIDWLNSYHKTVFDKVSPWLNTEETSWLEEKCTQISFA
jgi:Xaa-Pro aminopeptidase